MGTTLQETPATGFIYRYIWKKQTAESPPYQCIFRTVCLHRGRRMETTTDPVYKAMEIAPLGPCVLIDTAGFDDEGELGAMRMEKDGAGCTETELALIVFASEDM